MPRRVVWVELIRSAEVPGNLEFIYKVYKARFRYEKNVTLLSFLSEIAKDINNTISWDFTQEASSDVFLSAFKLYI